MAHTVISTCPVCAGELSVTRLQCRNCGTAIEGEFNVGRFGRLGREQLALLESFLRARGNLKELERELKVSYPTVRARVDALVRSLGLADGQEGEAFESDDEFEADVDAGWRSPAAMDAAPIGMSPFGTAGSAAPTQRATRAADTSARLTGPDAATAAATADARREVLERLARHEIGAEEAAALIRALGREA